MSSLSNSHCCKPEIPCGCQMPKDESTGQHTSSQTSSRWCKQDQPGFLVHCLLMLKCNKVRVLQGVLVFVTVTLTYFKFKVTQPEGPRPPAPAKLLSVHKQTLTNPSKNINRGMFGVGLPVLRNIHTASPHETWDKFVKDEEDKHSKTAEKIRHLHANILRNETKDNIINLPLPQIKNPGLEPPPSGLLVPRSQTKNTEDSAKPSLSSQTNLTAHRKDEEMSRKTETVTPRADSALIRVETVNISSPPYHLVPNNPSVKLAYRDCVALPQSPRPEVKICIYPVTEDKFISAELKIGRLWENMEVTQMSVFLQRDKHTQLVDLGANIGVFTLSAAALGRPVLAVEMMPFNVLMLQTSLTLSHLEQNVTLVNNAVYSDHRNLSVRFDRGNVGGTGVSDNKATRSKLQVQSICMDDLIPLVKVPKVFLKIDIEKSEPQALSCAGEFFRQINVPVILMEWLNRDIQAIQQINNFMRAHGYVASKSALEYQPENTLVATTPSHNVFFIK